MNPKKKEMTKNDFILFSGIIIGIIFILGGFVYTGLSYNLAISGEISPSSTTGLIIPFYIFFSLIIGIFMGFVGAFMGWVILIIIKFPKTKKITTKKALMYLLILFIIGLFIAVLIFGTMFKVEKQYQIEYENANQIGIKMDSNFISRLSLNDIMLVDYNLSLNSKHYYDPFYDNPNNQNFTWNNRKYTIWFDDDIRIINSKGDFFIDYQKNSKYDNIFDISYIPHEDYLFLLANLRPTSRRSLLLVFNKEGDNIYEELIDGMSVMEIAEIETGEKVIVIADRLEEEEVFFHEYAYKIN